MSMQALEEYEAAVRHHQHFQYTFKERQGTFTVLFMTTSLDYLTAMIRQAARLGVQLQTL